MSALKVSICIPTYNSATFLAATLASALRQQFDDYEVVVCDNASTDGTPDLVAGLDDPRLQYRRFETLVGQAANWNRCLDLARGEYVLLLHADDLLADTYLAAAVPILDREPSVGLVHCAVQHIDAEGAPLQVQQLFADDRICSSDDLVRRLLVDGCVVNPAGVLVRRSVYGAVGRFTEEIVWGVDWHMWLRVALHGPTAYIAAPLASYRQHTLSGTAGVMATARNGTDERWMMEDLFRRIPAERRDLHALHGRSIRQVAHRTWCFAEEMCRRGAMKSARVGVRRAVEIWPRMVLEPRVPLLWLATFLGYDTFAAAQSFRQRLLGRTRPSGPLGVS
jgi:glycosyltransferase involved in cell wall biosynthesis